MKRLLGVVVLIEVPQGFTAPTALDLAPVVYTLLHGGRRPIPWEAKYFEGCEVGPVRTLAQRKKEGPQPTFVQVTALEVTLYWRQAPITESGHNAALCGLVAQYACAKLAAEHFGMPDGRHAVLVRDF